MNIGGKAFLRQNLQQLHLHGQIGGVDPLNLRFERISAIGDAVEDDLRRDFFDQFTRFNRISKIDLQDTTAVDALQPPCRQRFDHCGHIVPQRGQCPIQIGSDEPARP